MRKSTKELTGLTAKEHKVYNVLNSIAEWYDEHKLPCTDEYNTDKILTTKINRYDLNTTITKILDSDYPVDAHTVCRWIKFLISQDFIIQNPTSHLNSKGLPYPSNKTMYFINIDKINAQRLDFISKRSKNILEGRNVHTHNTLDKYTG